MPLTIIARDETLTGRLCSTHVLELPGERMTIRELIRERVYQEVQDFNTGRGNRSLPGLVPAADAFPSDDAAPPGSCSGDAPPARGTTPSPTSAPLDWRLEFDKAVAAFTRNAFLILIDQRQATNLDEEVELNPATQISFVRLTLLVGG
jgi:hypothetical protein